jgi:hypothetical protein
MWRLYNRIDRNVQLVGNWLSSDVWERIYMSSHFTYEEMQWKRFLLLYSAGSVHANNQYDFHDGVSKGMFPS